MTLHSVLFFIIFDLPWNLRNDSGLLYHCLLLGFEFGVYLDWLSPPPSKNKEPCLICREKSRVHAFERTSARDWMQHIKPECKLISPILSYALITVKLLECPLMHYRPSTEERLLKICECHFSSGHRSSLNTVVFLISFELPCIIEKDSGVVRHCLLHGLKFRFFLLLPETRDFYIIIIWSHYDVHYCFYFIIISIINITNLFFIITSHNYDFLIV